MPIISLRQEQFDRLDSILQTDLKKLGIDFVLLTDMSGHAIAHCDHASMRIDVLALAALAAGSYAAVKAMAAIVGEKEFSLLFHKGTKESIHFSQVSDNFLLVTIFGNDMSLGLLRLNVKEAIDKIRKVLAIK